MEESNLQLKEIKAFYGNRCVLDGASLSLQKGEITCLCGPNGSGKSTILKVIANVPDEGMKFSCKESFNSADFSERNSSNRRAFSQERFFKLSYLGQNENCVWNYKVRDLVLQGRFCHTGFTGIYDKSDFMVTDSVLERLQIQELSQRNVFELSGGEYQKVRIARILVQDTDYLLLDEPLTALDFSYEKFLVDLFKDLCHKNNKAVLMSIHDLNMALSFADNIIFINKQKKLTCGKVCGKVQENILKEIYGCDVKLYTHPSGYPQIYL